MTTKHWSAWLNPGPGQDLLELAEQQLAVSTERYPVLVPRDDEPAGAWMYYSLPCNLTEEALDQLLHRMLDGISLETFRRLTSLRLVSAECHRLVAAAVISRCGLTGMQAQALISDHLYVIGEPDRPVAKVGRSADVRRRLRDLERGSPVRLVIRHVEPGLGGCEFLVHRVLASQRLHGEWFDFGSDDPGQAMREALRSLDELAWLRGLGAAADEARSDRGSAQLALARDLLHRAQAVETEIQQRQADIAARQKAMADTSGSLFTWFEELGARVGSDPGLSTCRAGTRPAAGTPRPATGGHGRGAGPGTSAPAPHRPSRTAPAASARPDGRARTARRPPSQHG